MKRDTALKMLAPYLAVAVFWCGFHNGWLAILAYHAQILFWLRGSWPPLHRPRQDGTAWLLLPAALTGIAVYFVLPLVTRVDLAEWLAEYRLAGVSLAVMVFYYGLVHPFLEQAHWAPLREETPVAHVVFAGYHMLVLYTLLPVPWLAACFAVLAGASLVWQQMARRTGGITLPVVMHVLADFGMVAAVWVMVGR